LEALAGQTAALHPELEGALPRTAPEDQRLFGLLKRAYIEARYSKSYRITPEELATLRAGVIDLAGRVQRACTEKLGTVLGPGAVGELPAPPSADEEVGELPDLPALDDPRTVESWREALVRLSYERGERNGKEQGERIGSARSIVDVLRRRGVDVADTDAQRILECQDQQTLSRWWDLAWRVSAIYELWAR
jgi:hypothetical protein